MATASYNTTSREFSGGSASDRLFLSDLDGPSGSPLTEIMEQVLRQTTAGTLTFSLADGSFIDLTGGLLILQNSNNNQELEFKIDGDLVIGGDDGELRERDFILVMGPYDLESIHTTQRAPFGDDAKIVIAEGSQYIIRHLHTNTSLAGEPGARTGFLLENNNSESRIRVAVHSGSAARNPGQTISGNVKINGDEIVHWGVTDQVPVREFEWIADYVDLRSAADGAPFTRATLISASGMKFLNVPFDHSVDDPLIYGGADAPFVVALGDQASHYWLFGIVSSEMDSRTVFLNLDGPDLNARFSSYTGGANKVARYEHHVVLDYTVQEPDGDTIEGAVVRVHCRRPSYSAAAAGSGNPAAVTFPAANAQVIDSTSDANGRGQIGTADGTLADAICIEAFGRRNTNGGGNRDGAYAGADNYRAAYGSHTALTYDVFAWGKQYVVGASWTAAKSGETGAGKQNLGSLVLNDDTNVTAATKDAVASVAATFDDLYDMLAEYAYDNNETVAATVADGVLTFTDANVSLPLSGSVSRSGGTVTIPCAAVLAAGTKITTLRATGTITPAAGVAISGPYGDVNGVVVTVIGYTPGHRAVAAAWPASQGTLDRSNIVTASNYITRSDASITAATNTLSSPTTDFRRYAIGTTMILSGFDRDANNGSFPIATIAANGQSCTLTRDSGSFEDESAGATVDIEDGTTSIVQMRLAADSRYYFVGDAVSYLRSSALLIDTGIITTIQGSLRRIVDTLGNDLIPLAADLTQDEKNQIALIEYDHATDRIMFGADATTNEFTFRAIARGIEIGQSSREAMSNPYIITISQGSLILENSSNRMIARASGVPDSLVPDLSSFQFSKVGSSDQKDFVDFEDGAIIVNSGVPAIVSLSGVTEGDFHRYMDTLSDAVKGEFKSGSDQAANGMTYFELWQFLGGIGGGRIEDNPDDSTKYDVYSLVDDNLIATIPKFVGETRAAGATVPSD